jgi:hypothetical protein
VLTSTGTQKNPRRLTRGASRAAPYARRLTRCRHRRSASSDAAPDSGTPPAPAPIPKRGTPLDGAERPGAAWGRDAQSKISRAAIAATNAAGPGAPRGGRTGAAVIAGFRRRLREAIHFRPAFQNGGRASGPFRQSRG